MFDLERDRGGEREPSREELKQHRAKEHNKRQKTMMRVIGENLASYACVLIFILLIGFIWTDVGIFVDLTSFLTDALVTVVLFILADVCMAKNGAIGGRLDEDYVKLHGEYLSLRQTVREMGIAMMDAFCDWQIDVEYEFYLRKQCKALKIDYEVFKERYACMTLEELKRELSFDRATKVFALTQIKRIELTPDILLTDGKMRETRGNIPESGEEYVERHTTGYQHILTTAIFGIVAAVPVFTLTQDVSVGRVIYTVFKLAMMSYRMYQGYSRGAKAYNTVEPKHLEAKIKYLYLYIEFLQKKIYLSLAGKYNIYAEGTNNGEDQREKQIDEGRAGGDQAQLGYNQASVRDHSAEVLRS